MMIFVLDCRDVENEMAEKEDFIKAAKLIVQESKEVVRVAEKVAALCENKQMKNVSKI